MKKKILSIVLAVAMCLSMMASLNVTVSATSWPSISSNKYIEFTAQQNINVYKDTACKTRGTSSPVKKYNASIAKGDICYIYKITSNYIQINYPTSSGRRTGYIKRSDLFDKTSPVEYIASAKAKVNVYKSTSGSYIAKKDKVWRVDPKKGYDGYRAVIYEAKSGKRAYKIGYITLNSLDAIKGKAASSNGNGKNVKVEVVNTMLETYKYTLADKKRLAEQVMEVVNDVNLRLTIEKMLGVSTVAVATLNPAELTGVIDEDAVMGMAAFALTDAYYQSAVSSHNKFLNAAKKEITTETQASNVFEYYVDALSKYNAVVAANIDTVERYTSKWNYRKDMLSAYLSSVADAVIPGKELKTIIDVWESANTVQELIDKVGNGYAGYSAMQETRKQWYDSWK